MRVDRFGDPIPDGYNYAIGSILKSTSDQIRKRERAWSIIGATLREKGAKGIFSFQGVDRGFYLDPEDLTYLDEELAPGLYLERFRQLALEMFGGTPDVHDVGLFNRTASASTALALALLKPGDRVVGIAPPPLWGESPDARACGRAGGWPTGQFEELRGVQPSA